MTLYRRSEFAYMSPAVETTPDILHLINTEKQSQSFQWIVYSAIVGHPLIISANLAEALKCLPSTHWISSAELAENPTTSIAHIEHLADIGLVISDPADGVRKNHSEVEEKLRSSAWHPLAAVYHFCTKWEDMHLSSAIPEGGIDTVESRERRSKLFAEFVCKYGLPPSHFHERKDAISRRALFSLHDDGNDLASLLKSRRTRRIFDVTAPIPFQSLSNLMHLAFGPQGIFEVSDGIFGIGKTSPFCGGLHPTEIYLLAIKVENLEPGLYHFNQRNRALDALHYLSEEDARRTANEYSAGQQYPKTAGAVFILTSRFYRNFWKYRKHPRAYPVLYMDIAHMSQSFYLLCERLGLGAFFTAAINSINIENALKLDPYIEGAMAMLGCGIPASNQLGLSVEYDAYEPRSVSDMRC